MGPGRLLTFVGTCTAALILVSGCGLVDRAGEADSAREGEQGEAADESEDETAEVVEATGESVTSRETNPWELPGGRAEVSLHRVDDEHMVAQMALSSQASEPLHFSSHLAEGFGEMADYAWDYFSGVSWLDPDGRVLHRPFYVDDEGTCLCTSSDDSILWDEDDTWEGYAVLAAPPEDVSALTVVTHVAAPFVNVPVEQGPPDGLDYQSPGEAADAEPEVVELESVIESDEDTVIQDSETTDINLSTDVLFELEESELTEEADELIDDAALELETLNPTEVTIEGHADDSGTDEINDPLSEDRAEEVRAALEERIDGDIDYQTQGFGSAEPIASNNDEEGRALNRRVTISVPRGTEVDSEPTEEEQGEDSAEDEPAQGKGTPAAEMGRTGSAGDAFDEELEVDLQLTALQTITPSTALLTYEVHNPNDTDVSVSLDMESDRWMEFRYHATHAVTLDDPDGDRSAYPLRVHPPDERDEPFCFCTHTSGVNLGSTRLPEDVTREYYAILPITPGTTVTDVTVGAIGTLEDVVID